MSKKLWNSRQRRQSDIIAHEIIVKTMGELNIKWEAHAISTETYGDAVDALAYALHLFEKAVDSRDQYHQS